MKLKSEYKTSGYIITYIKHDGDVYLYEKKGVKENWMTEEPKSHYEVVIPVMNPMTIKQRAQGLKGRYPSYPSDSAWGESGWTLKTIERAEEKFKELIDERKRS